MCQATHLFQRNMSSLLILLIYNFNKIIIIFVTNIGEKIIFLGEVFMTVLKVVSKPTTCILLL